MLHIIDEEYIGSDDKYVQMIMRIDLARALSMFALMFDLNVEVYNGPEKVRANYAVDKDDPDYEEDYEEPDIIIDAKDELTCFQELIKRTILKYIKDLKMATINYFKIYAMDVSLLSNVLNYLTIYTYNYNYI